ncbi:DNA-directed RNA polymerase subunit beta [Paenibacillus pinistramenti]|uniref:DNA-directed RNA polymerase subunit beta n=1 Tax=Paenibacillus pinistramenti TaxID=1768003 RepID=UPI0011084042|nr:DNA-directed RNA polymerase subunit beta [Paenibacillus pinistramenti]
MTEYTGPEQQERTDGPRRSRVQSRSSEQQGSVEAGNGQERPQEVKRKRRGIRTLIWTILIVLFLLAAGFGGVGAGYVIFGKQPWSDLLEWSTWRHVYDLVFAP